MVTTAPAMIVTVRRVPRGTGLVWIGNDPLIEPARMVIEVGTVTVEEPSPGSGGRPALWSVASCTGTGGGSGATRDSHGADAVHTHMTNTMNTPVEMLEHVTPLRVRRYAVRRGSGGAGVTQGGDGVIREFELLQDATVTLAD